MTARIHATAVIAESAVIGDGVQVWLHCQIREHAVIGDGSILGKNVYVDTGVRIGRRSKIQNNVSLFAGVVLDDGVFVGPHVCFTNDRVPRAINPDGSLKSAADWVVTPTRVETGVSIGANTTIVCGVTVGAWAMIGAGSVVTRSLPRFALAYGVPARVMAWVTPAGERAIFDAAGRFVGSDGTVLQRRVTADGERVECLSGPGAT